MENPVVELRTSLGWSRPQFARAHGLSYSTLANTEYGYIMCIPRRILAAMAEHGVNPEEAERQYHEWRAAFQAMPKPMVGPKGKDDGGSERS